jgi:pimeloyl-ACP methyl ester carboxylesterase
MKWLHILLILLATLPMIAFCLGVLRRPRTIRNFEEEEYNQERTFIKPLAVNHSLAIYTVGEGDPLLLLPYPHSQTTLPMAQSQLAELLTGMGRTVITFDVPGTYSSTREPVGDMAEMLKCAEQALDHLGIKEPIDVVGHSMSGLAALAFAIKRPVLTARLVLIGSVSGFPAATRSGMPGSCWHILNAEYWRLIVWGLRVQSGLGNLALHKKLQNLMEGASYYNEGYFTPLEIKMNDYQKGVPIREVLWGKNMYRRLSYADRLASVKAPTLVVVGRYDPETPVCAAKELHHGIPDSRLVIFEASGHFPFIEEAEEFRRTLNMFFEEDLAVR